MEEVIAWKHNVLNLSEDEWREYIQIQFGGMDRQTLTHIIFELELSKVNNHQNKSIAESNDIIVEILRRNTPQIYHDPIDQYEFKHLSTDVIHYISTYLWFKDKINLELASSAIFRAIRSSPSATYTMGSNMFRILSHFKRDNTQWMSSLHNVVKVLYIHTNQIFTLDENYDDFRLSLSVRNTQILDDIHTLIVLTHWDSDIGYTLDHLQQHSTLSKLEKVIIKCDGEPYSLMVKPIDITNLFEKYDKVQDIHLQVPLHSDLGLSNIQQRTQRTENGSWEWTVTLSDKQYGYNICYKPEYLIYEMTFKRTVTE
eukprot:86532_1